MPWQPHDMRTLVCGTSVSELLRVLAYPKFELTREEQSNLLADFLSYAEVVDLPDPWPELPRWRQRVPGR